MSNNKGCCDNKKNDTHKCSGECHKKEVPLTDEFTMHELNNTCQKKRHLQ